MPALATCPLIAVFSPLPQPELLVMQTPSDAEQSGLPRDALARAQRRNAESLGHTGALEQA